MTLIAFNPFDPTQRKIAREQTQRGWNTGVSDNQDGSITIHGEFDPTTRARETKTYKPQDYSAYQRGGNARQTDMSAYGKAQPVQPSYGTQYGAGGNSPFSTNRYQDEQRPWGDAMPFNNGKKRIDDGPYMPNRGTEQSPATDYYGQPMRPDTYYDAQGRPFIGTMSFAPGTSEKYQNESYKQWAENSGYYRPTPQDQPSRDTQYAGGSPNFDERTGRYVDRTPPGYIGGNQSWRNEVQNQNPYGNMAPGVYGMDGQRIPGSQEQALGTALAQRDAMALLMNNASMPYSLANAFGQDLGPQNFNYNSMLGQARDMVANGFYNPFTQYFNQSTDPLNQVSQYAPQPMYSPQIGGFGVGGQAPGYGMPYGGAMPSQGEQQSIAPPAPVRPSNRTMMRSTRPPRTSTSKLPSGWDVANGTDGRVWS